MVSQIRRQKPPRYLLVPDTNVLWKDAKDECVPPQFTSFWESHRSKYELDLAIPQVVLGELMFHHFHAASEKANAIRTTLESLSAITAKPYKPPRKLFRVQLS